MEKNLTWKQIGIEGYQDNIREAYYGYLPFSDYNHHSAQSERNHGYEIVFDSESETWIVIETERWFWVVINLYPSVRTVAAEYETLEAAKKAAQKHFEMVLENRK